MLFRSARLGRVLQFAAPESWEEPSPCEGWRNRDVMAHLAAQETAAVQVVRGEAPEEFDAFRAANGGDFWVDGFNDSAVRVRADLTNRRILEDWGRAADLLLADLGGLDDAAWNARRVPWVAGDIGIRYLRNTWVSCLMNKRNLCTTEKFAPTFCYSHSTRIWRDDG